MPGTPLLTDQQINDFHRDSYVIVRGVFDAASARRTEPWS